MSKEDRRKEDAERTERLPPIQKVVDRWFSDEEDGTEPPTDDRDKK